MPEDTSLSQRGFYRRRFLGLGLAIPAGLVVAGCTGTDSTSGTAAGAASTTSPPANGAAPSSVVPTPSCVDHDDETVAETEGPYFTPGSPERADLREAGVVGTALTVSGRVVDTSCRPAAHALLDFWQADGDGKYDNSGFRLRGHQYTGADGTFKLTTVVPGLYPGRTRHIHVKAQLPDGPVLTTQLYFPGEARNSSDGIFNQKLLLAGYSPQGNDRSGTFTFVLHAKT